MGPASSSSEVFPASAESNCPNRTDWSGAEASEEQQMDGKFIFENSIKMQPLDWGSSDGSAARPIPAQRLAIVEGALIPGKGTTSTIIPIRKR